MTQPGANSANSNDSDSVMPSKMSIPSRVEKSKPPHSRANRLPTTAPKPRMNSAQRSCDERLTTPVDSSDSDSVSAKSGRLTQLSRERFNEILYAARDVDVESLQEVKPEAIAFDEDSISIVDKVSRNRRPLSSMMVSTAFHLVVFLLLTILLAPPTPEDKTIGVVAAVVADPMDRNPIDDDHQQTIQIDLPEENQSPEESTLEDTALDQKIEVADAQTSIPSPVTEPTPDPVPADLEAPVSPVGNVASKPTGGGLEGRESTSRAKMAAERGGSKASEAAVENGLVWIINHQRKDGSWRLRHDDGRCRGQCPDAGGMESSTAATGLALMALLGAGYTHESGPYQKEMRAGLEYLINTQRLTKRGGTLVKGDKGMYSHAIATIALSEALAMTKDTWLVQPTEEARRYIETAQHRKGGWRYQPGNAGDMTVTGWQLMALKSCQLNRFQTPDEVFVRAESFIDDLRTSGGWYGYQRPSENLTTTAVAALMKMYLGAGHDNADVQTAAEYVAGKGPSPTDMYYNYYGTQVLYHRSGKEWKRWNGVLRDYLIEQQDKSGTHRDGSWYFQDPHGRYGGRLYTTAMVIMTLEVYYRYMPLYGEEVVSDFKVKDE